MRERRIERQAKKKTRKKMQGGVKTKERNETNRIVHKPNPELLFASKPSPTYFPMPKLFFGVLSSSRHWGV